MRWADRRRDCEAVRRAGQRRQRQRAVQHAARRAGRCRPRRCHPERRDAAPLQYHHRHRRHRDGASGDEVLAGQPRGHRRFGRAVGARPLLRRAGRFRGLRQVAAGDDDGDAAAQRAEHLRLWRVDPAGAFPRQGHHRRRRVRGGRALRRRGVSDRGTARDGKGRVPRSRRLRRTVHRQHDGVRRRSDRVVAAQQQHGAGRRIRPASRSRWRRDIR